MGKPVVQRQGQSGRGSEQGQAPHGQSNPRNGGFRALTGTLRTMKNRMQIV